jgi:acyl carrier protein
MTDATESVRDFLIDEHYWQGPREELSDQLPLIADRVIDSMGLLRLVAFLEEEFGVTIDDTEVVPTNFGTIAGIAALMRTKQGAGPAA